MTVCPLCAAIEAGKAVAENDRAVLVADVFPSSPGHHLVVSRRHEPDYFGLTRQEVAAIWHLVAEARERIEARWHPDGFNLGVNVGAAAGQTIGHVHVHVIPRYAGDVAEPRGGIRWILPATAPDWDPSETNPGPAGR